MQEGVFNWHTYGLKPDDLQYTFKLHKEICDERISNVKNRYENYGDDTLREDVFDDVFYYTNIENTYIWAACLWRLQGIFEGLIKTRYLNNKNRDNYTKILNAVERKGYIFELNEKESLKKWALLRNALSHFPPESFHPAFIDEERCSNYLELVEKITSRWEILRENIKYDNEQNDS